MEIPPEIWLLIVKELDTFSLVCLYASGIIKWSMHDSTFAQIYATKKEELLYKKHLSNVIKFVGKLGKK